jgi:hypothetical protein
MIFLLDIGTVATVMTVGGGEISCYFNLRCILANISGFHDSVIKHIFNLGYVLARFMFHFECKSWYSFTNAVYVQAQLAASYVQLVP